MNESAASVLAPEWFSPLDSDGVEIKPSFEIRALDGIEYLELMSLGKPTDDGFQTNHAGKEFLIRRGLTNWKDMDGPSGNQLPFSVSNAFKYLDGQSLLDIGNKVFMKSTLAEGERKNSLSQSK